MGIEHSKDNGFYMFLVLSNLRLVDKLAALNYPCS